MLNSIIKVDLHIHSKASSYKEDSAMVEECTAEKLDVLFAKLQENDINLFSITDHNTLDAQLYYEITKLIKKRKYPAVKGVIPGIEFDVSFDEERKPCHIMAYFDVPEIVVPGSEKVLEQLERIQNSTGKPGTPELNMDTKYSQEEFEQILKKIGFPVLLIAYQRNGLDAKNQAANSISGAVKDVTDLLEVGYIDGFDLQKPGVEGILKSNLRQLTDAKQIKDIAMLIASDCHQWSVYPKHHASAADHSVQFSKIKGLPTFSGLLMAVTSPETRFSRVSNPQQSIIKSFSYDDSDGKSVVVDVDPGINVIIGENGAGKSTLLRFLAGGKAESYQSRIEESNKLAKDIGDINSRYVGQAELIKQYEKGKLNNLDFYSDLFVKVDVEPFSKRLKLYVQNIAQCMRERLLVTKKPNSGSLTVTLKEHSKPFYVNISRNGLNTLDLSSTETHLQTLNNIKDMLKEEIASHFYPAPQEAKLSSILKLLEELITEITDNKKSITNKNDAKNYVIAAIEQYRKRINRQSTAQDKEADLYRRELDNLRDAVIRRVQENNDSIKKIPDFPDLVGEVAYSQRRQRGGYIFESYAAFLDDDYSDLEGGICRELFNATANIHSFADLDKIKSMKEWTASVKGASREEDIEDCLMRNVERYLNQKGETKQRITEQGTAHAVGGSTLGEQALVYYKVLTDSTNDQSVVFFFDQPEDNISNRKIVDELNPVISSLKDQHQVFLVTHNPLLVVNLDADNVIYVEGKKRQSNNGVLDIAIKSGCLEDQENRIMKLVANQMDGGKKAVEERLKRYGNS